MDAPGAVATLELGNDVQELARVVELLESFAAQHGVPPELVMELNVVLDEMLTNTMFHGLDEGQDPASLRIDLAFAVRDGSFEIRIEDNGRAFDPLQAPEVDLDADLDERRVGGLGIHLVRNLMDHLEYARAGGRNRLVMSKRLG
jgi:anti-sigma regulatory factor (Ser/Thr protein kinase)